MVRGKPLKFMHELGTKHLIKRCIRVSTLSKFQHQERWNFKEKYLYRKHFLYWNININIKDDSSRDQNDCIFGPTVFLKYFLMYVYNCQNSLSPIDWFILRIEKDNISFMRGVKEIWIQQREGKEYSISKNSMARKDAMQSLNS